MFTKEEATEFIEDTLEIKDPLKQFDVNRLVLLNNIIRAIQNNIPFQNITLLCLQKNDRRAPTMEEIKRDGLSLVGGICSVNNVFVKCLLETIGFNIDYVSATVTHPDNHFLCIASNVMHQGDKYMVEVGCGYPTFEAIPLDFEEESSIYKFSFMQFKLVRNHGIIERQHFRHSETHLRLGNDPVHKNLSGQWVRFYDFKVTPVEYCHFDSPMHQVYTVPGASPFLLSLRLVVFNDERCSVVRDNLHLQEGDDNKLHVVERLESKETMIACISKICPQLPELDIKCAVEMWETEIKPTLEK
ncbi:uncharacterized protein LOC100375173 [Saccoglossus kowalevskii]|uniref:arylamine N-acetyltransferase n=1 Tax=Saccoglossus kowalevskii TaxID=10224 RepID=A0ABM0GQE2_SACKO|nr:PREDICTED: uncharacterized protein LOC100375173 [Saccoglossus kowalevskii]